MSAQEHAIPERFFTDPSQCNPVGTSTPTAGLTTCPQGISVVKAVALAAQQGQRIYTITPAIYAAHPQIVPTDLSTHSADTQTRVQQALQAGLEVTIHQAPITESGWTGAGIIIIDPNTGAGGYLIEGGSNGGILNLGFAGIQSIAKIALGIFLTSTIVVLLGWRLQFQLFHIPF